nr:GTPase Era [bacterium]
MEHSGFIAVLGRSNAGKSTLVNRLVGQKVAIVSPKVQTTRSRLMGIYHGDGVQAVFLDTPGVHTAKNRLGRFMMQEAWGALEGCELALVLVDATRGILEEEETLFARVKALKTPVFCAVNKCDAVSREGLIDVLARLPGEVFADIFPISARTGEGVPALSQALYAALPEGPAYFPKDMYTDQPERRMAAEIIREQALLHLREEVPHGIGVEIEKIVPEKEITRIEAMLIVERAGHKGIVIGKGGGMLRAIGEGARMELEALFGGQVYLKLFVKVRENWRDSAAALKDLEYTSD